MINERKVEAKQSLSPRHIISSRKRLKFKKIKKVKIAKKVKRINKKISSKTKNIKIHGKWLKYNNNYIEPIFKFNYPKRDLEKENLNESNSTDKKIEVKSNIFTEEKKPNELRISNIFNNISVPKMNKVEENNFSTILNIKDNNQQNNNINNILKNQNLSSYYNNDILGTKIEFNSFDFNNSISDSSNNLYNFPLLYPSKESYPNEINLFTSPQNRFQINNTITPQNRHNFLIVNSNFSYLSNNQEINSNLNNISAHSNFNQNDNNNIQNNATNNRNNSNNNNINNVNIINNNRYNQNIINLPISYLEKHNINRNNNLINNNLDINTRIINNYMDNNFDNSFSEDFILNIK